MNKLILIFSILCIFAQAIDSPQLLKQLTELEERGSMKEKALSFAGLLSNQKLAEVFGSIRKAYPTAKLQQGSNLTVSKKYLTDSKLLSKIQ